MSPSECGDMLSEVQFPQQTCPEGLLYARPLLGASLTVCQVLGTLGFPLRGSPARIPF